MRYLSLSLALIFTVILLSFPLASASPSYKEIRESEMVENIITDTNNHLIYILAPDSINESQTATISTVSFINASQNASVELNLHSPLQKEPINMTDFHADENSDNETYYKVSWNVTPTSNTTYTLKLSIDGDMIFKRELFLEVIPLEVVDRTIRETSVKISEKDVDKKERFKVREALSENGFEYTPEEFEKAKATARENLDFEKRVSTKHLQYSDGSTSTETITYIAVETNDDKTLSSYKVLEIIPKNIANTTDEIDFRKTRPSILRKDPVIMWHVDDASSNTSASYSVDRNASITGKTIVLAESVNRESGENTLRTILAIALIPVVAVIIIYFNKFAPKTNE